MYNIYKLLPIFLQNVVCTIYGYREKKRRFGFVFKTSLDNFIKSDFSTEKEIETFKKNALINVLKSAKASSLYPSLNTFSDHDIEREPFNCLIKIPVLSKDELKGFCNVYGEKKGLDSFSTSGTTGKALTIFREKSCFEVQWAIWFRHRARFGVKLDDMSVNFTGKPVVPLEQKKKPLLEIQ